MTEHFEVEQIMDRRERSGKTQFMVKWCDSWVTEKQLLADSPNNAKILELFKTKHFKPSDTNDESVLTKRSPKKLSTLTPRKMAPINNSVNNGKQRNARKSVANMEKKTVSSSRKKRNGVIRVVQSKSQRVSSKSPRALRTTPSRTPSKN